MKNKGANLFAIIVSLGILAGFFYYAYSKRPNTTKPTVYINDYQFNKTAPFASGDFYIIISVDTLGKLGNDDYGTVRITLSPAKVQSIPKP